LVAENKITLFAVVILMLLLWPAASNSLIRLLFAVAPVPEETKRLAPVPEASAAIENPPKFVL
jgi:hypothetical protein